MSKQQIIKIVISVLIAALTALGATKTTETYRGEKQKPIY